MQEDFAKKTRVKNVVRLKLHFDIAPGCLRAIFGRFDESVEAEGGLLDFLGDETVAGRLRHVQADKFKGQGGLGLHQAVK